MVFNLDMARSMLVPDANWVKEWELKEAGDNPGLFFHWRKTPIWYITNQLADNYIASQDGLLLDRLYEVLEQGDCVSRWLAMSNMEEITRFDPQYVNIVYAWTHIYKPEEVPVKTPDVWTAKMVHILHSYAMAVAYRMEHYADPEPVIEVETSVMPKPNIPGLDIPDTKQQQVRKVVHPIPYRAPKPVISLADEPPKQRGLL